MKQLTSEAILLARINYGEADRIITFITPESGRVRAIAKGVRRQKSKLAGGIELFSISDITYIVGRSDLNTLVSTQLKEYFSNIVSDIERTMLGYEFLKILNKALEDEGGKEYYDLLKASLGILNNLSVDKGLAEASFLMQLMRLLGHLPNLTGDVKGQKLPEEGRFQFSYDDMAFFAAPEGAFTRNHIKLLRLLSHNPAAALLTVKEVNSYLADLVPLVRSMSRQYVVNF